MNARLRYLLLQVRNTGDPMRGQEVRCFARALGCEPEQIAVCDLLTAPPTAKLLARADVVLLGGSGDYSVAEGGAWLEDALAAMANLHERRVPTFASCWGFQAMARAMGGEVITDLSRAELGTIPVKLTEEGKADPVFAGPPAEFPAPMGHQDHVIRLPEGAIRLAYSDLAENQAFRFRDCPIYCTQFHPELDRAALRERVRAYPQYVEKVAGLTIEAFDAACLPCPDAESLLRRFVQEVFGSASLTRPAESE